MMHKVSLERLPEGLQFPAELTARISYAAEQRQLLFDGFMSKTDFDKLVRLHGDLAYQRALEQLFQACTFQASTPAERNNGRPLLLTGLAAAAFIATTLVAVAVWWK